jgi:hypothetical protein
MGRINCSLEFPFELSQFSHNIMAGSGDHCVHKITSSESGIFQLHFEVVTHKWQVIVMIMLIN